jgi:opacity protein-like surface antigen
VELQEMNGMLKGVLIGILLSITTIAWSQGSVRGFIKDASTGQPLSLILVGLEGTTFGTQTDENGFYSLTKIPDGTYTLLVANIEFKQVRETITVTKDKVISKNFLLEKNDTMLGEVEITADGQEQRNNVNISVETIRPQDIKRLPSIGGQPDLAQALTTLPGFVSTGDQGGQIYIRGGSPVQNKVLLDGMIVYNAFHSIGLFSVFDTDIIGNAEIHTGGFNAQHGGRISSIMDITTRDGNKREIDGHLGLNPFGVRAQIEGPLKKLTEDGAGISYIASVKHSYLNESSKVLYPYVNDGNGLPFRYSDAYGKISFGGANGSKFNLFGFRFADGVNSYKNVANLNWKNFGGGGNFVVAPNSSAVLISGNFAMSNYEIVMNEANKPQRSSGINGFNFGLDFKYGIKDDVLRYGVEVVGFSTHYKTFALLDQNNMVETSQNTTELNGFVDYKFNRGKWIVEPSLRLQYYSTLSVFSPEPRLGMKYKMNERLRLKAATGLYSQNLISINSDRDVVNLFYGFLTGPENLPNSYTTPNFERRDLKNVLQKALHYIAGLEYDLTERWNLNLEGYYRDFRQLTNVNRNKTFENGNGENNDKPEVLRNDYIIEMGRAYGVDFVAKYEDKRYFLWIVYSLSKVDRWDGMQWYPPIFDRRHNINIVGTYKFGKSDAYEVSARWNLGSGLPFTQTQGYYQSLPTDGNGISINPITGNPQYIEVYYGALNTGELPYYHRLDINLKRTFDFKNKTKLEANVGMTNAYNRANVFYIDRITGERVDQLPILPTIGLDFAF